MGRVLDFEAQVAAVQKIVDRYPNVGHPKFYITEWAYDWKASDVSPTFNGAYVAQSLYEIMNANVAGATYCGTLGFLEKPAPTMQAFRMFKSLEDNLVSHTNNHKTVNIIPSGTDDKLTLLVWDFPWQPKQTEAPKSQTVALNISGLKKGNYSYTRFLVDDHHMSVELDQVNDETLSSNGTINLEFELQPYGVTRVALIKK